MNNNCFLIFYLFNLLAKILLYLYIEEFVFYILQKIIYIKHFSISFIGFIELIAFTNQLNI